MEISKKHVPVQRHAQQMDARSSVVFDNATEAIMGYNIIKEKILKVYDWHQIAKLPISTFLLIDEFGNEVTRKVKEGDYMRINVPGTGNQTGDEHDWVSVEKIAETIDGDRDVFSITLRPTSNPSAPDTSIAHFFKGIATSTLLAYLEGLEVVVSYRGKNEMIDIVTDKLIDKSGDFLAGSGTKVGFSFPQWKSLVEGLVVLNENNRPFNH